MSRKAYSPQQRADVRAALVQTAVRSIAGQGMVHTTIDMLCKEAGISKTFFYTFFPSKEELMLEALLYQQPRLLERARALMDDPALTWRQAFRQFVLECTYGAQSGVAVLSIPEEQEVYRCLSAERFAAFQQAQLAFFSQLLEIFGAPAGSIDPKFFGSAALAMMMVYKGIPKDLPFLFPEAADAMVQFQLDALTAVLAQAIDGPSAPADPPACPTDPSN